MSFKRTTRSGSVTGPIDLSKPKRIRTNSVDNYQKPLFLDKVDKPAWNEVNLLNINIKKWNKIKLIQFSRLLHHCRSIQYNGQDDCGNLRDIIHSFSEYIQLNPKYNKITDPYYLFLDWSLVPNQPISFEHWILPDSCEVPNTIIPIENFENCYEIDSIRHQLIITGALVNQFPNLRVIPIVQDIPLVVEYR